MRLPNLLLALALSVSALPMLGCSPAMTPSAKSSVLDKPLPRLSGRTLEGKKIAKDTLANKVVVVKFFAKYCEPCKKTLPAAQQLHANDADIVLVGIAEDEFRADVEEMVKQYGLTFPILHDKHNVVAGRFRVNELPATFVTDTEGNIRWVGTAGQAESDLEAAVSWAKSAPAKSAPAK